MYECTICLENMSNVITCGNCNTSVCFNCMDSYCETCGDNKLAVCPYCNDEFLIQHMNMDYAERYAHYLAKYLMNNPNFIIKLDKNRRTEAIIKKLREQKRNRVEEFPNAVREIINICFRQKYNEKMRDNKKHIKHFAKDNRLKCFNISCRTGKLDVDELKNEYTCDSCYSVYCSKCEKTKLEGHSCNQEEIESLNYKSQLTLCPNCKAPAEKISGCDHLTCSICQTKFHIFGGFSDHGGHYYGYKQNNNYSFYLELEDKYPEDIINKIKNFENNIQPIPDETNLLNCFNEDHSIKTDVTNMQLFDLYSQFAKNMNIRRKQFITLNDIRKLHIDEKLTPDTLKKYL